MFSETILTLFALAQLAVGQSTFTPARPPAIPLAAKSPYLSCWQLAGSDSGNGGYLAGQWPTFWNGQVTAWTGLIRVDGVTYIWMGNPAGNLTLASQTSFEYTSTRSIFKQNVNGQVDITATFLSPVTPDDYMRSSLISSYLQVEVASADGQEHDIQLYTDISAEWISGDRSAIAQWDYNVAQTGAQPAQSTVAGGQWTGTDDVKAFGTRTSYDGWRAAVAHPTDAARRFKPGHRNPSAAATTASPTDGNSTATATAGPPTPTTSSGGIAYHRVFRQTQLEFSEVSDQTEYGDWYYMTADTSSLSHQSGADVDVRGQFVTAGNLTDAADSNFRAINNAFPVFGFAIDLGSVGSTASSSLFTINLNQEDVIVFEGANGNQTLPNLRNSYFTSDLEANTFFYNDYSNAQSTANDFDDKVSSASVAAAGQDYATLTTLSTRQAFATLQFAGTTDQTLLFMKEISSDGNINTVDVIFPWHPIALYTNPTLLKFLLEPLFINQEAGRWPFAFAIHDIGSHYPNATGHSDGNAEQQPLEECGNMIIMSLAYTQRTNDVAWLQSHYTILKQWAGFLIDEALIPADQISTDDFAGSLANQTNLALKGIIGIQAMSTIANLTSNPTDAANYTSIATSYINQWLTLSASNTTPPHTTLNYGNSSSYNLLYNLYASRLLSQGDFVPQQIYDQQSAFYPTVALEYGVPLDTRHTYTKLDWETWVAAIASTETRDLFLSKIVTWINQTPTGYPLTDLYETISGDYPAGINFIARPVVGGNFAILALPGQ
ncbi:transketolase [Elsinoe australis]|uniref:Transketolase n=1 Tax=Elsinoe australis TaxID=40998 RepID=A0A2P7YDB4_9PEZI|nr:transketolase [Elsinoe australis]